MQDLLEGQRCSARERIPGYSYRQSGQCTRAAVTLYRGHAYCEEHDPRTKRMKNLLAEYRGLSRTTAALRLQLASASPTEVDYKDRDKWILQRTRELVQEGTLKDPQLEEWCQQMTAAEGDRLMRMQQMLAKDTKHAAALLAKIEKLKAELQATRTDLTQEGESEARG